MDKEEMTRIVCAQKTELVEGQGLQQEEAGVQLKQNNTRDVWIGMREITGVNVKDRQPVSSLDGVNE